MGAFNTKAILIGDASLIPIIAEKICESFASKGFDTKRDNLLSGGEELFLSKGGVFKEIMGMRTALEVTLIPSDNGVSFEAGIGIFGQQFLPTVISMLFAWPVLLTQMWGIVQQSKLDDEALAIANIVISDVKTFLPTDNSTFKFCTECGTRLISDAKYCSNCGSKLLGCSV